MKIQFPIVGTHYWRAPAPPEDEWNDDLKHIAELGFEAIQLRVQWAWHERREGEYNFDEVTRMMDLAHARGLKTIVKFMLEDAPYWLFENYDAVRIAPNGVIDAPMSRASTYSGLSTPCFDRPLVREKADGFIRRLAEITCNHPSLILYSLWNEIRSTPYGVCACPESRKKFEAYLKERFGTVEALNRFTGKDFAEFSHFRPPVILTDGTSPFIWRSWCRDTLADTLAWVKAGIRRVTDRIPVIVHTGCNNMVNAMLHDATNDHLNATIVDMYGHSGVFWAGAFKSYEIIAGRAVRAEKDWRDNLYILAMQDNWVKNIANGKPTMNYELYSNDYGGMNPDFTGYEMNDFFLTSLSEGIRVLNMWGYKPERIGIESRCVGLVELHNRHTPRVAAVRDLIQFIKTNKRLLGEYIPDYGNVGIIYDLASDMISGIQENCAQPDLPTELYRYKNNIKGWYRLFWDANIPSDILSSESQDDWNSYQVIVLPAMMIVSELTRKKIASYVAQGGKLIVDTGFDICAANGWANCYVPSKDFKELFNGVVVSKELLNIGDVIFADSRYGKLPKGRYSSVMSITNGSWSSCELKNVMMFVFNPGEARFLNPKADFEPFYRWLDDWAGLRREQHHDLRIRKGYSNGKVVWFVHNIGSSPVKLPTKNSRDILNNANEIAPDTWAVLVNG